MILHHVPDGPEDAPPLLLGGSLGTTLEMWEPQLPALGGRVRTIRLDTRGHGRSPVPPGPYAIEDLGRDVLDTLDALGLQRVSFCGLSIGGMVGQWLGAHAPERLDRLVLLCTGAHLPPASDWTERAATVREAGTVASLADTLLDRWLTRPYRDANPDTEAWLRAMLLGSDPEGYAGCCEAIGALDLRAGLGRIRAPTLVIGAAQDGSIPAEHGRAIAAAVPGARFERLDPAAHLASIERADAVGALILDHLEAP